MIKLVRIRTLLIGGVFTLFFVALIGRMYWVQIANADMWLQIAEKEWSVEKELLPVRGTIMDRNGNILAQDALAYTVAVNPQVIDDLGIADKVVKGLHDILNKPEVELMKLATAKKEDGSFYQQREIHKEGWKIDTETADKVKNLKENLKKELEEREDQKISDVGIYLMDASKRYYPKNTLASHILGYMNKEGKPVYGIESYFNKELKGTPGSIAYEKDRKGYKLPDADVQYVPPRDGMRIKLTIDEKIQHYIEEAMQKTYEKYQPLSMTTIAVDPNTMEILGMANLPNFNPNKYWETSNMAAFFDHSIKSYYEPGSTTKIVTLAAAIEEGLFNPTDTYKSGRIVVAGRPIRDHNRVGWGEITYLEGLKRSSNVAFVKLGQKLGNERFKQYFADFGFGPTTGIELGGEINGKINMHYEYEYATATFGQGIAVTPIQQVAAVAAVANGGKLLQPHLVKEMIDPVTKEVKKIEPELVRQVISPETSKQVGDYLETVVSDKEKGTGRNAYIEGYRVAGKTGTAQKTVNKEYSKDKFVVSFIGYAPVEDPKILVYVVVDEPQDKYAGGGAVAAPLFKEIVTQSLRYMGVPSNKAITVEEHKESFVSAPKLVDLSVAQAQSLLKSNKLNYQTIGSGTKVVRQIPQAGTQILPEQRIYVMTEKITATTVPDLKGLSLRDALEMCTLLGTPCQVTGEGYVVEQKTEKKNGKTTVSLVLQSLSESENAPLEEEGGDKSKDEGKTDGESDGKTDGTSDGESKPPEENEDAPPV